MSQPVYIKQHDRRPWLEAQLLQDGDAIALDSADSVHLVIRRQGQAGAPTLRVECEVIDDETIDGEEVTAADGWVRYRWADGTTDDVGSFNFEFEVAFGAETYTVPSKGHNQLIISDDLDD